MQRPTCATCPNQGALSSVGRAAALCEAEVRAPRIPETTRITRAAQALFTARSTGLESAPAPTLPRFHYSLELLIACRQPRRPTRTDGRSCQVRPADSWPRMFNGQLLPAASAEIVPLLQREGNLCSAPRRHRGQLRTSTGFITRRFSRTAIARTWRKTPIVAYRAGARSTLRSATHSRTS